VFKLLQSVAQSIVKFIAIPGKYRPGKCRKCGMERGVWRDGEPCCYACDLIHPTAVTTYKMEEYNMDLNKIFELIDGLLEAKGVFLGLAFELEHGILLIDYVQEVEYPLENGDVDIVSGFVIDFAPFDELQSPKSYFAFDEEGVKEILDMIGADAHETN
jgi:hypothetical protein